MKLRLLNVYRTDSCLALLTEHDHFEWLGHIGNQNIDIILRSIRNSYKESLKHTGNNDTHHIIRNTGGAIMDDESIHIIGDFDSIEELKQWFQMQYLMDNISDESLKTITK